MRIRVLLGTAIAGFAIFALAGCQDDVTAPDPFTTDAPVTKQGKPDGATGDLYSDLLILYRDVDGLPIVYDTAFTDEHGVKTWCTQPVTELPIPNPLYVEGGEELEFLPTVDNPVSGRTVTLIPLFAHFQQFLPVEEEDDDTNMTITEAPDGKGPPEGKGGDDEEETAPGPCDILVLTDEAGLVTYDASVFADEVDLARLNLARSPEHVLRKQMDEVELLFAATLPDRVTLEAAGRFLFDGTIVDAAPKLQGIREALLETGTIPGADFWNGSPTPYEFPFQPYTADFSDWDHWQISAFALAGSASKFEVLSIDAIPYHDRVMGTAAEGTWVSEELLVLTHPQLGERFVDYSAFTYDRGTTFPGCATFIDPYSSPLQWVVAPFVGVGSRVEFTDFGDGGFAAANVAGYAQMAEDARAVIYFLHLYSELTMLTKDPVGMDTCADQRAALEDLNATS